MTTLREIAQEPESQALFAHLRPEAQRTTSKMIAFLDTCHEDRQDLALLGLECLAYAESDRPLPDDIKAALLGATYERACQQSGASSPYREPSPESPAFVDDDPALTLIDDGSRSGIRVERLDRPDGSASWLDFCVGYSPDEGTQRVLVNVPIGNTDDRMGLALIIAGVSINDSLDDIWTLADLRQLRDDLDRLLHDERLIGALAEQTV